MNVFGYLRVSGRSQIDGDGPERQRQAIKSFCDTHQLTFSGEFFERGISGTTEAMERPEFLRMLESIEYGRGGTWPQGPVEIIVVERMDRLARDLMVQEFLLAECRKRGIKVYSADQGALVDMASDGGDPTRKLIRQILGALAEWEKSQLVFKLRAARQRKKAASGWCEGQTPYGSRPAEQEILNFAVSMFETTRSYTRVAELLNDGGFKPRFAKQFDRKSVRGLILNYFKRKGIK